MEAGKLEPSGHPNLGTLTSEELTAIILRQQEIIQKLQQQVEEGEEGNLGAVNDNTATGTQARANQLQQDPYLVIKSEGQSSQQQLAGGKNCWTIGRSDDNDVVLPDCWLSRNHAMLQSMGPGDFYLIDLGSRNGTFVNGRRVNVPIALQDGDRLMFGQTEIEFYCGTVNQDSSSHSSPTLSGNGEKASATALLQVRRLITVLVVDIRNFTILTRRLEEQMLSEMIGTWFQRAGEIIREHGSWVDKYIGDAVMAVWIHGTQGIPDAEMKQIFRALRSLHLMTSQLHEQFPLPFPLRIGAGINTGYAMVGNAGSGDRPEYTALGDTVNTAFRLETSTKQLNTDIALGVTTHQFLPPRDRQQLPFIRQIVHLKGYEGPVPAYTGSFADLDTFLQTGTRVSDTLY